MREAAPEVREHNAASVREGEAAGVNRGHSNIVPAAGAASAAALSSGVQGSLRRTSIFYIVGRPAAVVLKRFQSRQQLHGALPPGDDADDGGLRFKALRPPPFKGPPRFIGLGQRVEHFGLEQLEWGVRVDEFHSLSPFAKHVHPAAALKLQQLWDSGNKHVSLLDDM